MVGGSDSPSGVKLPRVRRRLSRNWRGLGSSSRSIRGECNQRVFEAVAAGALLVQEADNREVPDYLQPGHEYAAYAPGELERVLEYHLEHEEERAAIAEAARAKAERFRFEHLWQQHLQIIDREWDSLIERSQRRPVPAPGDELLTRTWQMLGSSTGEDRTLFRDLRQALESCQDAADLHNALGLVVTGQPAWRTRQCALGADGRRPFSAGLNGDPAHIVGVNLVEALVGIWMTRALLGQRLRFSHRDGLGDAPIFDAAHFPPAFDDFAWRERAGWQHAAIAAEHAAKRDILRWRLSPPVRTHRRHRHAEATRAANDPFHPGRTRLPQARAGWFRDVIPTWSSTANPFDQGVPGLFTMPLETMATVPGSGTAAERRTLARAPGLCLEAWFADEPVLRRRARVASPSSGKEARRRYTPSLSIVVRAAGWSSARLSIRPPTSGPTRVMTALPAELTAAWAISG